MNFFYNERIKYDLMILGTGFLMNLLIIYCLFNIRLNFWFMGCVWLIISVATVVLVIDVIKEYRLRKMEAEENVIGKINRLSLLNENDGIIRSWNVLGKVSLLIGRDERNNRDNNKMHIDINLSGTKYAAQVSSQHAVLNWADGGWYIEDVSEGNGIEVQKNTGKRIKLSDDTACRLEFGDIIYIGSTRLKAD